MKILCTGCGQRFDDLLCGGICPYCGRYNDSAAQQQEAQGGPSAPAWQPPEPEGMPAGAAPAAGPAYAAPPAAARQKPVHTGVLPGILCAVLAILLLVELAAFPLAARAAKAAKKAQGFVQAAGTAQAQQNEAFPLGPLKRQVTVGAAERVSGLAGTPAGAGVVRVWCEAKKQKDYASWEAAVYLQIGDTDYAPIDEYRMESVYPELAAEVLDVYELSRTAMAEGWIYFAVPEGAKDATLWLQAQLMGRDYRTSAVQMTGVPVAFEEGGDQE